MREIQNQFDLLPSFSANGTLDHDINSTTELTELRSTNAESNFAIRFRYFGFTFHVHSFEEEGLLMLMRMKTTKTTRKNINMLITTRRRASVFIIS